MSTRTTSIGVKLGFLVLGSMIIILSVSVLSNDFLIRKRLMPQRSATYGEETLRYSTDLDNAIELISNVGRSVAKGAVALIPLGKKENSVAFRSTLEDMLVSIAAETPYVYGFGIWYEPNIVLGETYFGPYSYKEGDKAVLSYEYSNA